MAAYPFRIFLSYSHEDSDLANIAADVLTAMGLIPLWDKQIRPGTAFTEAIKSLIHHAHIFMPLITESSSKRPWVHQETGFAMALNIPVLPVAIDSVPGEMVSQLQAVVVKSDFSDFSERMANVDLEHVVLTPPGNMFSSIEISDWAERRTELLVKNACRVIELGSYGLVRQRASLSSFSIPDKDPANSIWTCRDGAVIRSPYYHSLQREERRAIEKHAQFQGCDLIIDPDFCLERNGLEATRTRLQILLDFLVSMPDDKVRVVMSPQAREGNMTLIGDWFSAESVSPRPGEGHRQTIFNWHSPTVLQTMRRFDEQFQELSAESGCQNTSLRNEAIRRIQEILSK